MSRTDVVEEWLESACHFSTDRPFVSTDIVAYSRDFLNQNHYVRLAPFIRSFFLSQSPCPINCLFARSSNENRKQFEITNVFLKKYCETVKNSYYTCTSVPLYAANGFRNMLPLHCAIKLYLNIITNYKLTS